MADSSSHDADSDFSALQESITNALIATTRATAAVCAQDIPFHRSLDRNFGTALDAQQNRILYLAENLLASAAAGTSVQHPRLRDTDAIDGNWRTIVEVVDSLLERTDTCLDEHNGVIKKRPEQTEDISSRPKNTGKGKPASRVPRNLDILKPQERFEVKINNDFQGPFKPLLANKPHAKQPLKEAPGKEDRYEHPYQHEIETFTAYPPSVYTRIEPIAYGPLEDSQAIFVDTEEAMQEMVEELKSATEIAIDLEHHDQRSYVGIVCLMQISTRNKDWIVDTLKPWRHRLQLLNEVFTDPNIVKVLHGSYMDIIWLQRDLGLYVVGLFDTYHASQVLHLEGGSLAYLLKKFCNFDAQKQYQLADWRVRPIPKEMLFYAQSDTHFLLYIFDHLRNDLLAMDVEDGEPDAMTLVLIKSKETSLRQYENPTYDEKMGLGSHGWYRQLSRTPALLSKEQFAVFRRVHQWRDQVARDEDESIQWVMGNHSLFAIAREMPADRAAIFRIAAPVSQPVRLRVDELVRVIAQAREEGAAAKEDMKTVMAKIDEIYFAMEDSKKFGNDFVGPSTKRKLTSSKFASTDVMELDTDTPRAVENTNAVDDTISVWSQFWGSIAVRLAEPHIPARQDISCPIPLPNLTAEIFAPAGGSLDVPEPAQKPKFVPKHERGEVAGTDDVFILNQFGGGRNSSGRKRPHDEVDDDIEKAQLDHEDDIIGLVDQDADDHLKDDRKKTKAEKKRARDEARRQRSLLAKAEAANGKGQEDEEDYEPELSTPQTAPTTQPFDYASAPSLINASQTSASTGWSLGGKKGKKQKQKPKRAAGDPSNPYDVYSRGMNAPKGLGKSQRGGGKSMTFHGK